MKHTLKSIIIFTVTSILSLGLNPTSAHAQSDVTTPSTLTILLEKGIYQEQTVGDLDAAINIYQQVVKQNTADHKQAAQAQYRLILCYLKKDDQTKARAALDNLIKTYPDQQQLITNARKQLPDTLQLIDTPWPDGEQMTLMIQSKAGATIGRLICQARLALPNDGMHAPDQKIWRLESYMSIPMISHNIQYTRVDAKPQNFEPMFAITQNLSDETFTAYYDDDTVTLKKDDLANVTTNEIELAQVAFDNEQAIFLIRRLPLAEHYQTSFSIFPVQGGSVMDCHIQVLSKESIISPVGKLPCWKVQLKVLMNGMTALTHTLWFSADKNHWLVQYDSGNAVMLLHDVSQISDDATRVQVTPVMSITQPTDWIVYRNQTDGNEMISAQLIAPASHTWGMLCAKPYMGSQLTVKDVALGDIKLLKDYFKQYTVQEKSWQNRKIADVDAVSYQADYLDKNQNMIEYRTYLLKQGSVYWFIFRTQADTFESHYKEYEQIINSLMVGQPQASEVNPQAIIPAQVMENKPQQILNAEMLTVQGWAHWRDRKFSDAEDKFAQAVKLDPTSANAFNGLGWAQFNQGKTKHAQQSFQSVLALNAQHPAALNGLGWINHGKGQYDQAITYWQKAIQASPNATAALNGLAVTYMHLKQYDKAITIYEQWQKVEPNSKQVKEGLAQARQAMTDKQAK